MRYEDGQIAELRWKATGHDAGLGKYIRQGLPPKEPWGETGRDNLDHWLLLEPHGEEETTFPEDFEVVQTFALIPVDGPTPTAIFTNHDLLMILQGRELTVATIGGGEIKARLATPIELIDLSDRAGRALEAKGLPPGPGLTVADAQRLSRAVGS